MIDGRERGWLLAGVGMLLVSTDSFFIRKADFDVWTISFIFGLGSTISLGLLFMATSSESPRVALMREPRPLVAIALLSSATQLSFVGAVNNTAVSNVVVIVAATPIVAAGLAWIVLRERTEPRVAKAIGCTVIGIVIVVGGSVGSPTVDGDLLALLAILFVSASLILWRRHPNVSRPLTLALSSAMMSMVAAPFASIGDAPVRVFVAAGLMGMLFNPLGRISYSTAPKYAPTAEVALFTPIETIAATIWAWAFFSERPSIPTATGGLVVIAAVLYGTIGSRRPIPAATRAGVVSVRPEP